MMKKILLMSLKHFLLHFAALFALSINHYQHLNLQINLYFFFNYNGHFSQKE